MCGCVSTHTCIKLVNTCIKVVKRLLLGFLSHQRTVSFLFVGFQENSLGHNLFPVNKFHLANNIVLFTIFFLYSAYIHLVCYLSLKWIEDSTLLSTIVIFPAKPWGGSANLTGLKE